MRAVYGATSVGCSRTSTVCVSSVVSYVLGMVWLFVPVSLGTAPDPLGVQPCKCNIPACLSALCCSRTARVTRQLTLSLSTLYIRLGDACPPTLCLQSPPTHFPRARSIKPNANRCTTRKKITSCSRHRCACLQGRRTTPQALFLTQSGRIP